MLFGDFARDGKPQAVASLGAGAGLVGAVEAVEDMRQVFLGDDGSGVVHVQLDAARRLAKRDGSSVAMRR